MEITIIIGFYIVTLLYSIILHEISHGLVALWLGDRTAKDAGRLTLDPLPHIDLYGSIILPGLLILLKTGFVFGWAKPVPYNPANLRTKKWGDVLVAFAGPLTNYLLALGGAVVGAVLPVVPDLKIQIVRALFHSDWQALAGLVSGNVMAILFVLVAMVIFWNVLLGTFNLLPIPPLDGSKLLFTLFHIPFKVRMFLEQWGIFIVLFFLFIPGLSAPFLFFLQLLWGIFFGIATL